jgi:hypothetical protein
MRAGLETGLSKSQTGILEFGRTNAMPLELLIERTSRHSKSFGSSLNATLSFLQQTLQGGIGRALECPRSSRVRKQRARPLTKQSSPKTNCSPHEHCLHVRSSKCQPTIRTGRNASGGCTAQNQQPKLGRRRTFHTNQRESKIRLLSKPPTNTCCKTNQTSSQKQHAGRLRHSCRGA